MSYSIDMYDKKGKVSSKFELDETLFSDDNINMSLIHEYYLLQTSNARIASAHTKTRWEVKWSWRKLFNQKGTGRARAWDVKSPIRRSWWVVFWPRSERNFEKKMPKKAKRKALYGLLTQKVKDGEVFGFLWLELKEPSTKIAASFLTTTGMSNTKMLVVVNREEDVLKKSFRNIDRTKYVLVDYLNPSDLLSYKNVLFTQAALEKINKIN